MFDKRLTGNRPANMYLFKLNNRNTRKNVWTYFTPFSSISIVDFEQENIACAESLDNF